MAKGNAVARSWPKGAERLPGMVLLPSEESYGNRAAAMQKLAEQEGVDIYVRGQGGIHLAHKLQRSDDVKPLGRVYKQERLNSWSRRNYAGLTPSTLSSVLRSLERGSDLEDWADLTSFMLRTDPHLRAVYDTRVMAGAGAEYRITPGAGQGDLAEAGAELIREALDDIDDVEHIFAQLNHAVGVGWSGAEHSLYRWRGGWNTAPAPIHARDIALDEDWRFVIRTYDRGGGYRWLKADDDRQRFILHTPSAIGETPNLVGALVAVAWPWLFKRWAQLWRQDGIERMGNPLMIGKVLEDAGTEARKALFDALKDLSGDHFGVVERGTEVDIKEPTQNVGEALTNVIKDLDDDVTKGLLGSTLNTEIGDTGGNRAAAESQAETTILPRIQRDVRALSGTIERDWFRPLLEWNAHRFPGGRVPPTPRIEFILEQEEPPRIEEWVLTSGVRVRQDEARTALGLEPLGPENGGELFIQPAARTTPGVGDGDTPALVPSPDGGVEEARPQDAALNGAQVKSLMEIVMAVGRGEIDHESAVEMIVTAFPVGEEQARDIVGTPEQSMSMAQSPGEEAGEPVPFGRKRRRPLTRKSQLTLLPTSPTSSRSRSPLSDVLSGSSDDRKT